jgi:hypothetical protein
MIYLVFLCTAYVGRPDLNACNQMGLGPFDNPDQCKVEMVRLREQAWLPPGQRTGMEGDGGSRMSDGSILRWHREYACKGHQTWTNVQ